MASVIAKLSIFGESLYGDQEKDANSLLMELDKGLRSGKIGEQCEAIVRFPRLFEKYPFPILINSSFLKVADVFRVGSNFLRLCVLQVTQQCEKHLEKITSIDEFVRRIYSVVHSNDPVARALTLRTLGSVACIISDRKIVHHCIINSLDSHDSVELEAAIFAAALFAAKSKSFASSICGKLTEMIECLSVPVDMKLKLLSVFDRMNCDLDTSQRARVLCLSVLHDYPSCRFVQATLHTLTLLSARSLVDIPLQLDLLLKHLTTDVRRAVKLTSLQELHLLALKAPHMWLQQHVTSVCDLTNVDIEELQLAALGILTALSATISIARLTSYGNTESAVVGCCLRFCYHENQAIAVKAAEMLVYIVIQAQRDGELLQVEELLVTVQSSLEMSISFSVDENNTSGSSKDGNAVLLSCLKSITHLCSSFADVAKHFIEVITVALTRANDEKALSLCECLSAIGSNDGTLLCDLVPDVVILLRRQLDKTSSSPRSKDLTLSLVRLLLHACVEDGLPRDVLDLVHTVQGRVDGWMSYKIGRQAARYGHHSLAADIFLSLNTSTSTEHSYFWLKALKDCCVAESCLQDSSSAQCSGADTQISMSASRTQFVSCLLAAEANYHMGIVALKAAATPTHSLSFQVEYFQLRTKLIQLYVLVVRACCSFQMSPPPAIATSLAMTTGIENHRCEHVLQQLKSCCQKFKDLEQKYQSLYRASFDADIATLANLDLLLQMCRLMIHVIERIVLPIAVGSRTGSSVDITSPPRSYTSRSRRLDRLGSGARGSGEVGWGVEQQMWMNTKSRVLDLLQKTAEQSPTSLLTHEQIACIEETAVILGRWRHCVPRYVFQRLQTTDIKVAISPSPRSSGDPISIHYDAHLTLKVEGVIQTTCTRTNHFNRVHTVQLQVNSVLESRTPPAGSSGVSDAKLQLIENPSNSMTQTVRPHNDYFSAQFLLAFPVTGLHLIKVEAFVVNSDGVVWHTGPRTSVLVKSYDEAALRQTQLKYAAAH